MARQRIAIERGCLLVTMAAGAKERPAKLKHSLAACSGQLLGIGVACLIASHLLRDPTVAAGVFVGGVALLALAALAQFVHRRRSRAEEALFKAVSHFVEFDASPSFTTDVDGVIGYQNAAARERFGDKEGATLTAVLGGHFASPAAVLFRLQNRADAKGAAREDVVTRRGHLRVAAHRIGTGAMLWRLEDIADRSAGRAADGISLPMLTVSKTGTVLFMNEALRRLVGGRRKSLDRIFKQLPVRDGEIAEISTPEGPLRTEVVEVNAAAERRELFLVPARKAPPAPAAEFEGLPVPLMRLATDGTVREANRAAQALLGYSPGARARLSDLVDELGRPVEDWIADVAAGHGSGKPERVRAHRVAPDRYVQVTLEPRDGPAGPELIAALSDATELTTLEAQFVQSQKMQAIGQLAGGVAHDFNNLLTAIGGHCDLLLLRHDPGDADFADLEQINQNANRAAALVGQLLAFSRKQTLQIRTIDLRDTLTELTHLLNRLVGEKVSLELSPADDLRPVRADPRQLEQVVVNLVVNARDAMPDGGTIRISSCTETLRKELRRDRAVVPPGTYSILRVEDEGAGISPSHLPKIFEPFFTTKRTGEGTGLGLSTVYGIVKQTGGYVFADSTPGEGTRFSLYFPVDEAGIVKSALKDATPDAPVLAETGALPAGVVLLVEDEAPVRAFASRALRLQGFTVLEAASAEEALEQLRDESLAVDVFVTDVVMPGMDGPSWVSAALEQRPDTRVVFVSGYSQENLADSQARIPQSTFLAKPFSLNQLTETVQRQLH
ncbi:MAG: ATP-binding protein [Pseudomonadota bacterium]